MLHHPTLDKLTTLRLTGMHKALSEQLAADLTAALDRSAEQLARGGAAPDLAAGLQSQVVEPLLQRHDPAI